eukprot:m.263631 g.263631  ORF g.263631 m.263631 type:complete len:267 (-) comp19242_c1_seq3:58-858(-)
MAKFPVSPRYAKMLTLARHYDCFDHVVAIVAALTVRDVFESSRGEAEDSDVEVDATAGKQSSHKRAHNQWKLAGISGGGDLASLLSAVGATDYAFASKQDLSAFCRQYGLRLKAIQEIRQLRKQLLQKNLEFGDKEGPEALASVTLAALAPPSAGQADAVRQIVLTGFGDHVARLSGSQLFGNRVMYTYECDATNEAVYIHPNSVLAGQNPEFVVYHTLFQGKTRLYMKRKSTSGTTLFSHVLSFHGRVEQCKQEIRISARDSSGI